MTEEGIINDCKNNTKKFSIMTDMEIYNWLCNNYPTCRDYELLRRCSFIIFKDSRNV